MRKFVLEEILKSLEKLSNSPNAHCVLEAALEFADLRLVDDKIRHPAIIPTESLDPLSKIHDDEVRDYLDANQGQITTEQFSRMNLELEMLSLYRNGKSIFADSPDFLLEFSSYGKWPTEHDTDIYRDKLLEWYEFGRSARLYSTIDMQKPKRNLPANEFMNKFGNTSKRLDWYYNSKPDTINHRKIENSYNPLVHHSFGKVNEHYVLKTIHVAVNFVDLGSLLSRLSVSITSSLSWYGYESSPYAVAKTSVIATMITEKAPVDCILQAWFSSCWSVQTLTFFRTALKSVLEDDNAKSGKFLIDFVIFPKFCRSSD